MTNKPRTDQEFTRGEQRQFSSGLTLRALIWGALGSALLTASSLYVALRMGALPWPTVFASIAAMSILKLMGNTNLNEINVTQTAMTAGAMIAGGMAFTLPGLWAEGQGPQLSAFFLPVLLIALAGLFLGLALTWYWRPMLLEQRKLPFPIGMAAAETIKSGDAGGSKGKLLAVSLAISAVFTFIRDWLGKIPQFISFTLPGAAGIQAGVMLYPMAPAIGYMIGGIYTAVLFGGALLAYFIILPFGVAGGFFADAAAAASFKDTLGLGLMVGAGLGTLLRFFHSQIKERQKAGLKEGKAGGGAALGSKSSSGKPSLSGERTGPGNMTWLLIAAIGAALACVGAGMGFSLSLFVIAGTFLMTLMACLVTGESGIDPMEIFGIIVMMGAAFLFKPQWQSSLMVAAVVAVASGFAGDTMFDYRAGQIIGTNPKEQLIAQGVGGLLGAVVASFTLFVVIGQFGPVFSDALPAPQARLVFSMVNSAFDPLVFWSGAIAGAALCFFGLPATTLGIGLYLPFAFSAAIFIGGVIRWVTDKLWPQSQDKGMVLASGVFGGESLTGVLLAFLSFFTALK
ncbi:MAG: OPT/YSL family transporter [Clostridiales bacterium]